MRFPKSTRELLGWYGAYAAAVLLLVPGDRAPFWLLVPAVAGVLASVAAGALFILGALRR